MLDSGLKSLNSFSPEVYADFITANTLKFIFSLVKLLELFLYAIPESYADLGREAIVRQVF